MEAYEDEEIIDISAGDLSLSQTSHKAPDALPIENVEEVNEELILPNKR